MFVHALVSTSRLPGGTYVNMPDTTRTFVALPMTEAVVSALERLRVLLEPEVRGARWCAPANLHVTLAFLGDVGVTDLANVCKAVSEAVPKFACFDLEVGGGGASPDARRPRVLWAGLSGPHLARLQPVQKAVAAAATRAGYRPDDRFSPHVTLARFASPGRRKPTDVTEVLARHALWSGGVLPVREVVVYSSSFGAGATVYTPLARTALVG